MPYDDHNGFAHDLELMGIVEMCRDENGEVDINDALAMAACMGHDTMQDFGLIDIFASDFKPDE